MSTEGFLLLVGSLCWLVGLVTGFGLGAWLSGGEK